MTNYPGALVNHSVNFTYAEAEGDFTYAEAEGDFTYA